MPKKFIGHDLQSEVIVIADNDDADFELPVGSAFKLGKSAGGENIFEVDEATGNIKMGPESGGGRTEVRNTIEFKNDVIFSKGTAHQIDSEIVGVSDPFALMNAGYTAQTDRPCGFAWVLDAETPAKPIGAGGFISTTQFEMDVDPEFGGGDIINIVAQDENSKMQAFNMGLFEVSNITYEPAIPKWTVQIKPTPTIDDVGLFQSEFVVDTNGPEGYVAQVRVSVQRANPDGTFELLHGSDGAGLLASAQTIDTGGGGGGSDLQATYDASVGDDPMILLSDAIGDLKIEIDETATEADFILTGVGDYLKTDAANDALILGSAGVKVQIDNQDLEIGKTGQTTADVQKLVFNLADGEGSPTAFPYEETVTGDFFGGFGQVASVLYDAPAASSVSHIYGDHELDSLQLVDQRVSTSWGDGYVTLLKFNADFGTRAANLTFDYGPVGPLDGVTGFLPMEPGLDGKEVNIAGMRGHDADATTPGGDSGDLNIVVRAGGLGDDANSQAHGSAGDLILSSNAGANGGANIAGQSAGNVRLIPGAGGSAGAEGTPGTDGQVEIANNAGGRNIVLGAGGSEIGMYGATPTGQAAAPTAVDVSTVDATYGAEEAAVINSLRVTLGEVTAALVALGAMA